MSKTLVFKRFVIATALILLPGSGIVAGVYLVYRAMKNKRDKVTENNKK